MSKLGETADRILEQLNNGQKLNLDELEEKNDIAILYFMNECGLIELEKEEVRITDLGSDLLTLK